MISQESIENWFSYHSPSEEQLKDYAAIRTAGKIFAETINKHVPDGADKTATIRKLREVVWSANAGIACYIPPVLGLAGSGNYASNPKEYYASKGANLELKYSQDLIRIPSVAPHPAGNNLVGK